MKRFWIVMLSLGLIAAFAMPAAAVDVKFNGVWYMAGWYADNRSGLDKDSPAGEARRGSAAYYTHKLRLNTTFQVVEGLALKTQFDALETMMGDNSWAGGGAGRQSQPTSTRTSQGAAGSATQENIEFEAAWAVFKTPIGQFQAGFMPNGLGFGTIFLNDPYTWPTIRFDTQVGPVNIFASIFKIREWKNSTAYARASTNGINSDADSDAYRIGGVMKFAPGEAGLMYEFWRDSRAKSRSGNAVIAGVVTPGQPTDFSASQFGAIPAGTNNGWITAVHTINPYTKLKFGPAYVEAEAYYRFGKLRQYEAGATDPDIDLAAYGGYIHGRFDFKPFFAGAQFVMMSGDDMKSNDKVTGSVGQFFGDNYVTPVGTMVLWNFDYLDAMGPMTANASGSNPRTLEANSNQRYMDNVWFYSIYGGMNVTPKLNFTAKVSYATADKKPKAAVGSAVEFVSDKYGTEVDLVANYKIYDNLTYTVGGGYLFIGDYFKGTNDATKLKDNYVLTHKITLAF